MDISEFLRAIFYILATTALAVPLGLYMAAVYSGKRTTLSPILAPVESWLYRSIGTAVNQDPTQEMTWRTYGQTMLIFNALGLLVLYAIQRFQHLLPLNPESQPAVPADTAFNTAISFASNTNWQCYGGESSLSYLTQMCGLGVQNFLSAATGMAVLVAFIRGFTREGSASIGSFWVDLTRSLLYVLLPLSVATTLFLVSQGVVQTFNDYAEYVPLETKTSGRDDSASTAKLALGPAASQIAIKQLGTNGGGFFNTNSSHPLENPTPLSNLIEMIAILLIPAALCITFGKKIGDSRQGWAIFSTMLIIVTISFSVCFHFEQDIERFFPSTVQCDSGNMEGKETRFGVLDSCIWAIATTAASNGSVNSMHDSFSPLGGSPMIMLMDIGEVAFGGVGCGLYGMIVYAIIAVFIAGLMVGRTPEYLGKKIEAFEIKMSSLILLIPSALVLVGTAIACSGDYASTSIANPGPHGFSEVLYAFSSAGNNNGSAFAGFNANTPYLNYSLGVCMFISRYWIAIAALAIAGSLAQKKRIPAGEGTLPTHTPLFVTLLVGVVLIFGVLTFIPSLCLGPIAEHFRMKAW